MKLLTVILLIFFGFVTLLGCKKNSEQKESISFVLDGVKVNCDKNIYASLIDLSSGKRLSINGDWGTGNYLQIDINNYNLKTGEWLVSRDNQIGLKLGSQFLAAYGNSSGPLGSGKIVISKIEGDYITGSFECTTYNDPAIVPSVVKQVTNGFFYLRETLVK